MPASAVTGGAAAKKRKTAVKRKTPVKRKTAVKRKTPVKRKTAVKRKTSTKRATTKKTGTRRTMDDYEGQARKMGIPLSKDGHKKTKEQLQRAIAYRKSHVKR